MECEDILNFLRRSRAEIALDYRASIKGIFGSIARDEARPDSDVDVLVQFEEDASVFDLVGLADFLEENLNRKVDIVSVRAVREEIRPAIERDLIKV